jgi:amino acid adenylation domain-containing protein
MNKKNELLAKLSPEKRKLVLQKLQQQSTKKEQTSSIVPVKRKQTIPLSFAQQRLWFLDQLEGGSSHYNEFGALRIEGQVDISVLQKSLTEMIKRHEILRTIFPLVNGSPVQTIMPSPSNVKLPMIDLQALSAQEQSKEVQRLAFEESQHAFDLAKGPLIRFTLLRLGAESHVFFLNLHHIICDNWSGNIFNREMLALYQAYSTGAPYPLPALPLQYADFAHWQHQWLKEEALEKQLQYWQLKLADAPALLKLPTDKPRPAVQTFKGQHQHFQLSPELTQSLKRQAQKTGTTLFMMLLAAFVTLLYRYSGQEDVVIGTPVANRHRRELEEMIGLFINTLVLRIDLSAHPTVQALLARVRQMTLEAYAHQELPFERLVETLQPERNLSHTPLFQVMFGLHNAPVTNQEWSGLTFRPLEVENHTAKFDMTLLMKETDSGLTGIWEYNTDLFEAATIKRMIGHFKTLIESMLSHPEKPIAELQLLTQSEQQQILVEWNNTVTPYPQDKCLHQLFEAQVERTPNAIALIFENQQLTYQALNQRANQLAHHLQTLGIKPEELLGIYIERSVEMVIGLLGILKAGGAYIPIEPSYPQERVAFMLEDAGVSVLLTQSGLGEHHFKITQLVFLDRDWAIISQASDSNPVTAVQPDNLAYVIYTSGSTGQPKGAMNTHLAICNRLLWMQDAYRLTAQDRVLQKTPFSFDVSVWEFFWPLLTGACLVVAKPGGHQESDYLVNLITQQKITTLHFVPSMLRVFLETPQVENCHSLRQVICSGEELPFELQERFFTRLDVPLHNLYGPTEAAIDVTFWPCERNSRLQRVPIGRPIANTQIYILDHQLLPVPIGVPGELHIGGVGLARGYLNRPELTQEKFIPNPFSNEPRSRLYKTGDLARFLPDGNIEYLGRIDNQVKIRGFRIELGEIETALAQHDAIREAVVVIHKDQSGDKRLVAYITPTGTTPSELRQFLKTHLPDYMIPSHFVMLEVLPLTPNGKIDRRALAQLAVNPYHEEKFVAPRHPEEELLAGIWASVLGLEQAVGIHDNFFELGGHSLLVTQVVSRIRDAFSIELPMRRLFEFPTLAELSQQIDGVRYDAQVQAPPIVPIARSGKLPLSFAQERLWFLDQLEGQNAIYNIPATLRLSGELNVTALEQSFNEIIRRHEVLRTTVSMLNGQPVQVIAPSLTLKIPIINLQALSEIEQATQVQNLATEEAQRPFDLAKGPLVRVILLRLRPDEHVICVTQHHIVSDGWSTWIFIKEMTTLYEAFSKGQPSPLPELPIQYADFTLWQRQWLSGEVLEKQLNYWQQQLANVPPVLKLPTDHPRPSTLTFRGQLTHFTINEDITKQLKALSLRYETTLFMVLLAAYAVLLFRYSGQEDIVIGSPIANRNRKEIESLIGFFVNTLTLRFDLSGQPTFLELLKRVRQITLDAYTHQDTPFEQVVEAVQPERNMSHTPLFQVMFGLQNVPSDTLKLPELTVTPLAVESGTARCDLTLLMEETEQGLTGVLEYSTDLFEANTMARMIGHFETLLSSIADEPQQVITQLQLLTEAEQHQLVVEWNNTQTAYPYDLCIHQLFEAQVEQTPEAVAVVFANQQLTYQELNVQANQLAHWLHTVGVGPEVLVALCVERSLEMVIGLLGIVKAGGAYVPLDPDYPRERLAFMLEDARVSILLTQDKFAKDFDWISLKGGMQVICLDTDWENFIAKESKYNLINNGMTAENLAYVIYTSGSTGIPKGVAVSHRSINRLLFNTDYIKIESTDRIAQASNASFDAATFEIWGALLHGARLVGVNREVSISPPAFAAFLREQAISVLFLTTALFNQLAREIPHIFSVLQNLLFGGEAVDPTWVKTVLTNGPPQRLLHVYGPTENTTFSSWYLIEEVPTGATTIPIGRPIANSQIYILDAHLQPVPVGVPGELHIGGDGLARGYLNRPELTSEKFIPNPFSDDADSRLYKTGDLVRYRVDGNIEFLGRFDNQVKIRGFRIELGEIETVLTQHPAVLETVVIVREYQSNDKRLVAYIVSEQNVAVQSTPSELLRFLKEKLPDYMVPSALVMLDALPLNPNGKVDRNALPAPENLVDEESYVAPRTPTEEILAGLFANILKLEQVGIHDDFFERGGHSLLATQLISRIRNTFSIELPLRQLFESPTIVDLAARIEAARREELSPPIQPIARDKALSLSFAQERLWFLDQLEPGNPFYNVSIALRLKGMLLITALEQSLIEIVQRHEVLRTTFAKVEGKPVQMIAPHFPTIPILKILEVSEEQVQSLAIEEAQRTFDLAKDALLRTTLLRLSETESILLLTMHHTVSDGWSLGVLVQELLALYPAFSKGESSPLPKLAIQYADFAHWQRQWLTGDVLETQLNYWKQQLAGAPPVLKLPTDRPHPAVQSFRGSSEQFHINSDVTQQLKYLTQQTGATLFMTLLAAFATLLSRYSDQDDMVIGAPIANRNRAEIESLIGFFVNTLALRIDLSGNPTFPILLERVRQVALDAYSHQDLPFEKLVDELQIERDLSFNPLFQVMFALQNAPMETLELPDLNIVPLEMKRTSALFDIVLDIWEVDDHLIGVWEYNTDIFDASTIVRMAGHFQTLLAGIAANPEQPIFKLPLLTEAEKYQLLSNGISKDYPVHKPLHHLFEKQAEATPDQVAAVHANQSITYAQLNARANQIAHWLRRIQANHFVAILEERGIDFLAAMLGILKAGGAFLPIDPSYPDDRVRYMVADSQIHTLITRSAFFDKIASDDGYLRYLLCFDDIEPKFFGKSGFLKDIEQEVTTNPNHLNEPTDIAYMLYTSGSTGLPKGTMVRHNGAVNHIYAEFDELAFHQNTAFLQSAPSSSDISVWQFLAPLLIGGRTVIVDFETVCDPVKLFKVIKSQQVTLIELVPVVMQGLLEYVAQLSPEERALPDLEWAMVTGEAVSVALVNQWLQTYPNIKLVNAYGPTEAADDICQAVLDKPLPAEQLNVPIGKPLANLSLYVLDRHLQLLPIGVNGEICVSGIGVGAGYWCNEEKTRAAFVNNPYVDDTYGDTIYRTGDLGRWLPDGSLEFIGRLDHQVKIRGFRIELGEIEGVLSQYPAVRETVVIDREDQPGDKRLVAYLVANMQDEGFQTQLNELQTEQVSLWQDLHEDSYSDASHDDPTFNIIGWDSTYTGQQLPDEEMHECVETTIDRILSLQPQNVLEIGCGTGLLMYRIVPHCKNYVGTDLSSVALKRLEDSKSYVNSMEHVTLLQKMADDFEGFETDAFDTLVMNSVVQYFPSIDYLLQVLKASFNVVKTGGAIFIGDVRSLPLLESYHASVQFYKAEDTVTRLELEQRICKQRLQEQELAIDPAFFMVLKAHFPQVSQVEIQPERGFFHNEMTRFRYDVILHLKVDSWKEERELVWLDWQLEPLSLSDIRQQLVETQPPYLALRHVANARLETETKVLGWLANAANTETVAQLRESLSAFESKNVDPEALWQLTQELPYDIHIHCSLDRTDGSYDVIFKHHQCSEQLITDQLITNKPWSEYANNPLQEKLTRKLLPPLRSFLKEKLPAHMLPTDFVVLKTFPLMPNGKVDREALPAPDTSRNILTEGYVVPRNPIEEGLATIWAEVLGLEQVGIHDNFFELGGHSLKATQVISRIHKDLGVEMAVRDIFNRPTIAELAIDLSTKSSTSYFDIERVPDADHYPVSHAQRRLWVLAQMEGGSAAYHIASAALLEGHIEAAAFERAFSALVERHESLRTTFISVDGEPRQQVHSQIDAQMGLMDLTSESDPRQRAQELALEDARTGFDLENGPLIRMSLLKLADEQSALLFNMHHIISDGWSLDVLVREFLQLYTDFRQGKTPSLPPLRIQYRDYALWQNNLLQSEAATIHRDYWHEKLAGEIPVLNLPSDFPRPPIKTFNGKQYCHMTTVPMPDLQNFSRQHNVSLFMTLVALLKVLFYRYTAQEDIIIGSPMAGRDHADLENQIGFYVNTLVLRDQLSGEMSFADFLQQVRKTTLEAYEHQIYPFDRLVQDLNLHRDVSRSPLFDVMLVMQNVENVEFYLEEVQVSPLLTEYSMSQFDLTLSFEERHNNLYTTIWYNTDLFLEERIVRLIQHFETLVTDTLADANQPIARLNILPKSEQQKLLYEFNGTTIDCPRDKSLVDLFEDQVKKSPTNIAVTFENQKLTYRELNRKANQLAHHLIDLGIGANVLVGICVERSLEMIVGILGILKAGGAYVPLDPTYPQERLAFMLEDSQVSVLLTQSSVKMTAAKLVYLDTDWEMISQKSAENPSIKSNPENTAYVIYTSGSTGKPKGVLVTHANVARLFSATQAWYHFNEQDVWTLFHSYAFDFSVWELWGALLYGGRLVVVPYLISRSPEAFYDLLDSEGVTVLNQTPSAFGQLIQVEKQAGYAKPLKLRTVIFGGEALDIQSLQPWFERHGDQKPQLVNMYGITETTVHVTYRPLTISDLNSQGSVIGRAIPDLQVYILDQHGQAVPIGVPGELHIGGAGLAKGYLNRPELTTEKFIHYSLTIDQDQLQCRLYKTGDLARYLSNGDIEYLGRIDNQVKIRGFRIELGEIESVLATHPSVQTVIVRDQKRADDNRLVAYIIPVQKDISNTSELRHFLQDKLPDYMVPAAFIILEAFPLTPSGKIDIRALPAPDQTRPDMETTYVAPQSELERTLAAVWQEALGVEKVGIQDNVFDLGAHSVLIIQVRKKLGEMLKQDIPVVQLFKYPTIGALAEYLSQTQDTQETAATAQLVQDRAHKRKMARQRRKHHL